MSLATMALLIGVTAARAENFVTLTSGAGGILVVDQGIGDDDLDPNEIEVNFTLQHPQGLWTAEGKIIAIGGGEDPPFTILTDLEVVKKEGGFMINDFIKVVHEFAPVVFGPDQLMALDGEWDNVEVETIGDVFLSFSALAQNDFLGAITPDSPKGLPGPVPFSGTIGPTPPPDTFITHTLDIMFYLDFDGDAFRFFDSAAILSVPEPAAGTAMLALLVGLGACRLRRRAK